MGAIASILLLLLAAAGFNGSNQTEQSAIAGRTIVIDPGHNGGNSSASNEINRLVPAGGYLKPCNTTGTATADGRLTEAKLNFEVAKRLRGFLEDAGARVVMTRTSNRGVGPCVNRRAATGNRAHADAVISIHADGAASDQSGFHVIRPGLVRGYNDGIQRNSNRLSVAVRDALDANPVGRSTYIGHGTGLDRRTDLAGLNLSHVPVVMVEIGNMKNPDDQQLMESSRWRAHTARELEKGLLGYFERR